MSKKFSPMRFTAATEEAAIEGALQLVGATRDEISYDFISQTAKGVTIRIRPFEEEEAAPPASDSTVEFSDDFEIESAAEFDEADEDNDGDADEEEADEEEADDLDDEDADDELSFDADLELAEDEFDAQDSEEEEESDGDNLDEGAEDEDGEPQAEIEVDGALLERALTMARTMLDKMGLDARVEAGRVVAPDTIPLSIEGEDVGILIGKHGATLQSFQYLMNLALNKESETLTRVSVDAGNYHARRRESLEAVARGTAQRVRREGRPIKMEPMPSNERRIVHDILQSEAGISTQSEGREPHRCIVVAPGQSDYSGATEGRGNHRSARGMGGRGRGGRRRP